ncbi:MAG: 6-phosphogluconate dehydrogenase, decarboxylating [Brockia lithotrophica]|uniref:6-phosphogluconate dehydrogenase, decarboxylating n=1 Tax=Brockia lithotrophica TaxID=933949 RepID=A0A2T5G479_9BACL|nr:NADP-dependent phosphogluconate dehydrogenase [Brockia lithotrophica]PTQ50993.1 MAG: 6-phosphogluconate dehydrogenase, decarboxylating [Brockia lithotrophica]
MHDIGIYGLGVMGENLALRAHDVGLSVAVFNRTKDKAFALAARVGNPRFEAFAEPAAFVASLRRPRLLLLMVTAGPATDAAFEAVLPFLEEGDVLVDGGNAHYEDTLRREARARQARIAYVGMGISGGELGARTGPALMPGGDAEAYTRIASRLEALAARLPDGRPAVAYMGKSAAGHYVKMVHNGIEYVFLQLLAEAYDALRNVYGYASVELADAFARANQGPWESYLIGLVRHILTVPDPETSQPLVEQILDVAEGKGTGLWTAEEALRLGVGGSTFAAAVHARNLSRERDLRLACAEACGEPWHRPEALPAYETWRDALHAAVLIAYAQGFALLRRASETYDFAVDLANVAQVWQSGAIVRIRFLANLERNLRRSPETSHPLLFPEIWEFVRERENALRSFAAWAVRTGMPAPAHLAALADLDGLRRRRLPANLIQAARDAFGAHTYRRIDREGSFHTSWPDPEGREIPRPRS